MKKIVSWSVLLLTIISLLVVPVHQSVVLAQDSPDSGSEERITMSPAVTRPSLVAGEKIEGKLTVINDGSADYTFLMYSRPFSVDGEDYNPNYTIVNKQTEAYQWVEFEKTEVRLKAGERVEVGYSVQTPPDARAGGHYAVLFAETQPPEDSPASVARKKRIGTLLYMTVAGDIIKQGSVESWQTPLLQTKRPLKSDLRVRNDGNTHFQANLSADYKTLFGKKKFTLNQELLILPGTTRKIAVAWQDAPYIGIYKASGTVSFLDKTDALPERFVVLLPIPVMAATGGVVVLLILATIVSRKRRLKSSKYSRATSKKG